MSELTPTQTAEAVEELYDRVLTTLDAVEGDAWHAAVPACPRWDVHDLVGHVGAMTTMFCGLPQPEPPEGWSAPDGLNPIDATTEAGTAGRRAWGPDELRDELRTARDTWAAQLRAMPDLSAQTVGPTGPMSMAQFVSVRMFDLWHHLIDLHQALHLPIATDEEGLAARECYGYVVSRVPWLLGKKAAAPDGATVHLRLTGPPLDIDRTVGVRDGRGAWVEEQTDSRVTGPVGVFALLMTGRLDRDTAEQAGLRAEGPEAERLLGVRMFT